ncbi:hypothetical protein ACFE04_000865 [Oxalis oulophora]
MVTFLKQVVSPLFLLAIINLPFLFATLNYSHSEERSLYEFNKWHVYVTNSLSNNEFLSVHCESKDDDLGLQNLPPTTNFTWSFRENLFETTLFWCDVSKDDASASLKVFWHDALLFYKCLWSNCIYVAKDDGIYIKNLDRQIDELVQQWNPV